MLDLLSDLDPCSSELTELNKLKLLELLKLSLLKQL